jgi:uncharacterized protein YwgA
VEEKISKFMEVLHYITSKIPGLSRVQLVKLIYMSDRDFYKEHKDKITKVNYFMHFYGPYCNEFNESLFSLKAKNLLHEESCGSGYKIYCNGYLDYNLSKTEKSAIDNVIDFAKKEKLIESAKNIKEYIYSLSEVKSTGPLDDILFGDIEF